MRACRFSAPRRVAYLGVLSFEFGERVGSRNMSSLGKPSAPAMSSPARDGICYTPVTRHVRSFFRCESMGRSHHPEPDGAFDIGC